MTKLLRALSSRATTPVVLGIFLIVYIVLAFGTEDALIALMAVTASSLLLKLLLGVLPLNSVSRLFLELSGSLRRGKLLRGTAGEIPEGLFEEKVAVSGAATLERVEELLKSEGYRTRRSEESVGAWRGWGGSAVRVMFLAATTCLFAGILISVASRSMHRATVIEGEPFPTAAGGGGVVEKIDLAPGKGPILAQTLTMQVAPSQQGDPAGSFGLYPPSMYRGCFVYPRYLGVAPQLRIVAPELPGGYEAFHVVNIYPPGREDKAAIPDSPYSIMLTLAASGDGSDPFVSGHGTMLFKLLKGKEVVVAGSAPLGGEFARDGYRIGFPTYRRTVQTDFVQDYGVPLIWISALLFALTASLWLPVRTMTPRREMLFLRKDGKVWGFSRAEGGRRAHGGVFHEALDLLEGRSQEAAPAPEQGAEMAGI